MHGQSIFFRLLLFVLSCITFTTNVFSLNTDYHSLVNTAGRIEPLNRDSAMSLWKLAIAEAEKINFEDAGLVQIWIKVSNYDYYRGKTENAIKLSLKAMNYADKQGNTRLRTQMQILTGDILRGNNLYQQAEIYLTAALVEAARLHDSTLLAKAFNRISAIEAERRNTSRAELFGHLSLHFAEALKNDSLVFNNLNILGFTATWKKNYSESNAYLQRAMSIAESVMPDDAPLVMINLARNYNFQNRNEDAITLSKKALEIARKMNIPQYVRLAALNLNELYIKLNDYKSALNFDTIYYHNKEFILNQKVQVQVTEFNSRLASQVQISKNQNLLYEKKIAENKLYYLLAVGFLLIILILALTALIIQRHYQHKKMVEIARKLDQSNQFLKRFISILAHDLRSPFTTLLGYSDLLKNENDLTDEERKIAYDSLFNVSQSTFNLLERLLQWSRLQAGTLKPDFQETDLSVLIHENIENLKPAAELKQISLQYSVQNQVITMVDPEMINTTLRNLVSNAIKFTFPGGKINVDLLPTEDEIKIKISDTGVGISSADINKLFEPGEQVTTKGTQGEKGSGLGLMICREYIRLHDGDLQITSVPEKGSVFTIVLGRNRAGR